MMPAALLQELLRLKVGDPSDTSLTGNGNGGQMSLASAQLVAQLEDGPEPGPGPRGIARLKSFAYPLPKPEAEEDAEAARALANKATRVTFRSGVPEGLVGLRFRGLLGRVWGSGRRRGSRSGARA